MNHYLELKKEQVKNWSKIGALILTVLPRILKLRQNQAKTPDKAVWILLILLTLITYLTTYYTFSSLFWPETLSIFNHLWLVPGVVLSSANVYEGIELVVN